MLLIDGASTKEPLLHFRRGQDLRYHVIHVGLRGAVIDYAGAQAELAAKSRVGKIHPATAHQAFENGGIPPIEFVFRGGSSPIVAKANCTEFDPRQELQSGLLCDAGRQALRQIQIPLNRLSKRFEPVIAERKPKSQRTEAARKFK